MVEFNIDLNFGEYRLINILWNLKAEEISHINIRSGPTAKSITPLTFRLRLFRLRMVLLYSLLKLDQKWHWRILVAILARSVKSSV